MVDRGLEGREAARAVVGLALASALALGSCEPPTVEGQSSELVPPHTHAGEDIVDGVIDDARLSSNVSLFSAVEARFRGSLAWGGGPAIASSEGSVSGSALDDLRELVEQFQVTTDDRLSDLESRAEAHTHAAEAITSGTLSDQRLSSNVPLASAQVQRFTGALAWGGGPPLPSSGSVGGMEAGFLITERPNVFTAPQTFDQGQASATVGGPAVPGSGTAGLQFDRLRTQAETPLGISWTVSGIERWAFGLDATAEDHPDFVLLYNTDVGDIFRVADGAHFQMGAGVGPTPDDNLLLLNDRPGSGNEAVLKMLSTGDAGRWVLTVNEDGGVPWSVGRDGSMGIGTDHPRGVLKLDVQGPARATAWTTFSDASLKTDVEPLEGALDKLARVQASRFRWADSGAEDIGVIAQELEKVFPELVTEVDGVRSVDYGGLTAVLLAAVQELAARCAVPDASP